MLEIMKNGKTARISKLVDFYDFLIFDVFELSGAYPASQISRQPLLIQSTVRTLAVLHSVRWLLPIRIQKKTGPRRAGLGLLWRFQGMVDVTRQ
jgi:hypothetical protein